MRKPEPIRPLEGLKHPSKGPGTNTGHGHVWPRPDGRRSRCSGAMACSKCQLDASKWKKFTVWQNADSLDLIDKDGNKMRKDTTWWG